nr:MAG TPA: hypothetical protein [Caudoviricetes sp.]
MLNLLFLAGFEDDGKYSEIIGGFPHFFTLNDWRFRRKLGNFGENWRKLGILGDYWRKERIW